jgi:phosphatidylglycerophosphate synthase
MSTEPKTEDANRRPIAARSHRWAGRAASKLAAGNISPNQISVASAVVAIVGAALLVWVHQAWALIACAACIQARLVCNLLDGMVAIEGGKKSPVGALYNEFPDRIADSVLIVALGYAAGMPWLGWLGALGAALTAYVRLFGGAIGLAQDFRGPFAKQQRMAVMTAGCVIAAAELLLNGTQWSLLIAAAIIAAGSLITCGTRTWAIARQLKEV